MGLTQETQGVRWRVWLVGVLAALVIVVAFQNSQEVEIEVLFVETRAPLIVALLIALGVGALIGYVAPVLRRHRRGGRPAEHE